ncbi:MAG: macro domain-containing protein [Candidatus Micrarchaeota archaeon]
MQIVLVQKSIVDLPVEAIINAADVSLKMNGGVAAAIKKKGGKDIEDEAVEAAPAELGQAIATSAGKLDAKFVIHAAAIKLGVPAIEENIRKAIKNSLELADSLECESLAIPAIGTGAGGFPKEDSARVLLEEISAFKPNSVKTILVSLMGESFAIFQKKAGELNVSIVGFFEFEKQLKIQAEKHEAELDAKAKNEPEEEIVAEKAESFSDEIQKENSNDS